MALRCTLITNLPFFASVIFDKGCARPIQQLIYIAVCINMPYLHATVWVHIFTFCCEFWGRRARTRQLACICKESEEAVALILNQEVSQFNEIQSAVLRMSKACSIRSLTFNYYFFNTRRIINLYEENKDIVQYICAYLKTKFKRVITYKCAHGHRVYAWKPAHKILNY